MTTKVTVDAHAGWPVMVTLLSGEPGHIRQVTNELVEPGTTRDFYIHSGLRIINIDELVREAIR